MYAYADLEKGGYGTIYERIDGYIDEYTNERINERINEQSMIPKESNYGIIVPVKICLTSMLIGIIILALYLEIVYLSRH